MRGGGEAHERRLQVWVGWHFEGVGGGGGGVPRGLTSDLGGPRRGRGRRLGERGRALDVVQILGVSVAGSKLWSAHVHQGIWRNRGGSKEHGEARSIVRVVVDKVVVVVWGELLLLRVAAVGHSVGVCGSRSDRFGAVVLELTDIAVVEARREEVVA